MHELSSYVYSNTLSKYLILCGVHSLFLFYKVVKYVAIYVNKYFHLCKTISLKLKRRREEHNFRVKI